MQDYTFSAHGLRSPPLLQKLGCHNCLSYLCLGFRKKPLLKNINMNRKFTPGLALLLLLCLGLTSCKSNKKADSRWIHEDDVRVGIDETFRPIMDNLANSFAMQYKEATMNPDYVSEDQAIRLLVNDSVRCIVVTRKISDAEQKIVQSHRLEARQALIASDAIALVVNRANPDSLITLDEIKSIVTGKTTRWEQLAKSTKKGELKLVFDNSGSSTVRFMRDSLCNGNDLKGNVYASEGGTNQSVLKMVEENPDIIGIVGANWLMGDNGNALSDFSRLPFKVMRVSRSSDETKDKYVRPYQYYIATAQYPLLRSVYAIQTDPRSQSMLKNFFFYLKGQKGQTIICNNSQMLPITPVEVKDVSIK